MEKRVIWNIIQVQSTKKPARKYWPTRSTDILSMSQSSWSRWNACRNTRTKHTVNNQPCTQCRLKNDSQMLLYPFDAHYCREGLALSITSECPDVKNYKW